MKALTILDVLSSLVVFIFVGTASGECPDGWIVYNGSCYLIGHDSKTFTESQHFCEQHDANLVTIETQNEQTFLQSTCTYSSHGTFWIGLSDADIEDIWKWNHSSETAVYTAWYPGQPDDSFDANCAAVTSSYGYKWADRACSKTYHPLCEKSTVPCNDVIIG